MYPVPRIPRQRSEFIPALPKHALFWLADELGPAERRALREIVEIRDLVEVDGQTCLVAPVSDDTVDALAAFEAEGEDREIATRLGIGRASAYRIIEHARGAA